VPDASRAGYGDALRSREFAALFAGQTVSVAGGSVAAVALSVLVYDRTGSAFLSALTFAGAFGMYSLGLDGRVRDSAPDRLFARTMTLNSAGLMTLQGLGFALAGAVAEAIGAAGAIAAAGACGLVGVAGLRLLLRRGDGQAAATSQRNTFSSR
jgi:hypothetical protein